MTRQARRPETETSESVYSNFDHTLEVSVIAELEATPDALYAQHAAWDFCGSIWKGKDGMWYESVWRFGAEVDVLTGETITDVIIRANNEYGSS